MGTIADKLARLRQTKAAIRAALVRKGQSVAEAAPFSSYAARIDAISTGPDTSDATATPQDMGVGATAYVNGQKIEGVAKVYTKTVSFSNRTPYVDASTGQFKLISAGATANGWLFKQGGALALMTPMSNLGDATAADVRKGKTFTSTAGIKVTGTGNF